MVGDAFLTVQCLEFSCHSLFYIWVCSYIQMEKEKK